MGYKIMVSAAALRTSGARTIYRQFIEHLRTRVDGNSYYIMIDKEMEKPEIAGVTYLTIDTSSKFKRLMFDWFVFDSLVKKNNIQPDAIVSLQNVGIKRYKSLPQIVYYHNSLPFFRYKWNIFKKGELIMFLYKHFYPFFVKRTIGRNTEMVAQLPSIKKGIVSKFGLSANNVHVLFPDLENIKISEVKRYAFEEDCINIVFPATDVPYKGHAFLVNVMEKLYVKDKSVAEKVRIHLTLDEKSSAKLVRRMEIGAVRQNFVFHGVVKHDILLSMYKGAAALLFPSVIETLGLPLVEAAKFGLPIIACDLEYAHEVLQDYSGAKFIESRQAEQWADGIITMTQEKKCVEPLENPQRSSWEDFFDLIEQKLR